jgi:hypothetical protein
MSADCNRAHRGPHSKATTVPRRLLSLPACGLRESRYVEPCGGCVTEPCGPRNENPTMATPPSSGPEEIIRHVVGSAGNSRRLWPATIWTDNPQVVLRCAAARTLRIAAIRRQPGSRRRTVHCVADAHLPHGNVPASHRPSACVVGRPGTRRTVDG